MGLILVGTNHQYSPLEIREKLAFSKKRLPAELLTLKNYGNIRGAVILSTCNRVELYASVEEGETGIKFLEKFLIDYHQPDFRKTADYFYKYRDKQALEHLLGVTCGIDSQIIGETQILEQVESAYHQARLLGCTDELLDDIFVRTKEIALKVRENTEIEKGDISLGTLTVKLINQKLKTLEGKKILIIGSGKISELVVKALKDKSAAVTLVSNHSYERARELADYIGAEVIRFDRLKQELDRSEVIISATSSPHIILKKEDLSEIKKPLLVIDLSVPRDVDPAVKGLANLELFCLDDLNYLLEEELKGRRKVVPLALDLIKEQVEKLCQENFLKSALAPVLWP